MFLIRTREACKVGSSGVSKTRNEGGVTVKQRSRFERGEGVGGVDRSVDVLGFDVAAVNGRDDAVERNAEVAHVVAELTLADLFEGRGVVGANVGGRRMLAVHVVKKTADVCETTNDEGGGEEGDFRRTVARDGGTVTGAVDAAAVEEDEAAET